MIHKLKRLVLHWCLLIAGRIDESAVGQVRIGTTIEINLNKIIPPDGKMHHYGATVLFKASMVKDNDAYTGSLTIGDIKVYQEGAVCKLGPEGLVSARWKEKG